MTITELHTQLDGQPSSNVDLSNRSSPVGKEERMMDDIDKDNVYFKQLLDLVPAQIYFNEEAKGIIRNKGEDASETKTSNGRPAKKMRVDPINKQTVSNLQTTLNAMEEKIKGKKESKQKKKKKAGKEKTAPTVNIQEMQEKLRARIAQLQAKRAQGLSGAEQQEQKRLERKQRRMNANKKNKNKNKGSKASQDSIPTPNADSPVVAKRPNKPIVNKEGKMVFSKFDFTQSGEKEKHTGTLVGKDYKRLLAKLEQRDAKVAKVKESDPDAAAKLEQKHVWQDVLSKAKGEKVKDDPVLLKRALKRKEKMKTHRVKKWDDRKQIVEKHKNQRQDKREKNLQKRKDDKKAKHRKKLIKKGRILPGF
ncbi:surfeit locus protein 6 homolog [Littorina saxatilis]|uniref:Ribosomal RNA-processing protein 14/surfeit locus protein 6 C-terminal domain-containing protein n=1 Tax=Littorina saxatilis TaxID=31220 RepID=A0AAN9AXG5_9CAEN